MSESASTPGLTRRSLLLRAATGSGFAAAVALLAACSQPASTAPPTSPPAAAAPTAAPKPSTPSAPAAATSAPAAGATAATKPGASGGPTAAPAVATGGSGALRMLIHQNKPFVDYMNGFVTKFQQKYPDIKVDMPVVNSGDLPTTIQTRLSAGDLDLYEQPLGFTNAPQPFMKNIDDPTWVTLIKSGALVELSNQPFIKYYDPQALKDASTYNGGIYSVTTGRYAYSGVFYNKDIFAQNNLQVPTTWSEFTALCDTLTSKNIAPMTVGAKDTWPLGAVGDSGLLLGQYPDQKGLVQSLWTSSTKFNDPKSVEYFTRGAKYLTYFEKGVGQIDYNTAPGRFATGKSAMYPGGTWDAPTIILANSKINMGYFPFPGADDAAANKSLVGKYDVAWFLPSNSQNTDAALKFIDFFSQPETYAAYVNAVGVLPVQPNASLTADYAKEITPLLPTFSVAYGEMMILPKNIGKYAGFDITNMAPLGDVSDPKDMANKSEADWEAALKQ